MLEVMDTVPQEIPKPILSNPPKNMLWILALLIVALLSGAVGYSIGLQAISKRGSPQNEQQSLLPSPTANTVSPSSNTIDKNILLDLQGVGELFKTQQFMATNWDMEWSYDCMNTPEGTPSLKAFKVYKFIYKPGTKAVIRTDSLITKSGNYGSGKEQYHSNEVFSLGVDSTCAWTVKASTTK